MSDHLSIVYKYIFLYVFCVLLSACGGSGDSNAGGNSVEGDATEENVAEESNVTEASNNSVADNQVSAAGLRIDENNYENVFRSSVVRAIESNIDLQDYFNGIDLASLSLLSVNGNVSTYRCSNQGGTLQVTPVDRSTEEYFFTNCDLPRDFPAYRYNNKLRVKLVSSSGDVNNFPDLQHSWSQTQAFKMANLNLSPVAGDTGNIDIINGNATLLQSNDATSLLHHTKITSTNLTIDRTNLTGVKEVLNYSFFLYDDLDNNNDASSDVEINFNASNISGIGDIVVITNPVLKFGSFDSSLESGVMVFNTSASTVIFQARGGDRVDVFLDPEKDGSFQQAIPTSWRHLDSAL